MANNFKSKAANAIGTNGEQIYTCDASTQTTVIGLSLANRTSSVVLVDVELRADLRTSGAQDRSFIVKNASVPAGSSLVVVGGDQKLVLEPGDKIEITPDTAASIDAIVSVLEIT